VAGQVLSGGARPVLARGTGAPAASGESQKMSHGPSATAAALVPLGPALGVAVLHRGRIVSSAGRAADGFEAAELFAQPGAASVILLPLPSAHYLLRHADVSPAVAPRHVAQAALLQVQAALTVPADAFVFAAGRPADRAERRVLVCAARRAGLIPSQESGLEGWPGLVRWIPDALLLWQAFAEHLPEGETPALALHHAPPHPAQLLIFAGPELRRQLPLAGSLVGSPEALAAEIRRALPAAAAAPLVLLSSTVGGAERQAIAAALGGIEVRCVGPAEPAAHAEWLARALAAAGDRRAWRPPQLAFTAARQQPGGGRAPGVVTACRGAAVAAWAAALLLAGTGLAARQGAAAARRSLAESARVGLGLSGMPAGAELATIRNVVEEEMASSQPLFAAASPSLLEGLQIAHASSVSLASVEWRGFQYAAPVLTIQALGQAADRERWVQVLREAWPRARVTPQSAPGRVEWQIEIDFTPSLQE